MPQGSPTLAGMIALLKTAVGEKPGKANDAIRELIQKAEGAAAKLPTSDHVLADTIEQLQSRSRPATTASKKEVVTAGQAKALLQHAKKLRTYVKKLHRAAGKAELVQACRDRLGDRVLSGSTRPSSLRPIESYPFRLYWVPAASKAAWNTPMPSCDASPHCC